MSHALTTTTALRRPEPLSDLRICPAIDVHNRFVGIVGAHLQHGNIHARLAMRDEIDDVGAHPTDFLLEREAGAHDDVRLHASHAVLLAADLPHERHELGAGAGPRRRSGGTRPRRGPPGRCLHRRGLDLLGRRGSRRVTTIGRPGSSATYCPSWCISSHGRPCRTLASPGHESAISSNWPAAAPTIRVQSQGANGRAMRNPPARSGAPSLAGSPSPSFSISRARVIASVLSALPGRSMYGEDPTRRTGVVFGGRRALGAAPLGADLPTARRRPARS